MNFVSSSLTALVHSGDCAATLQRLIGNLRGFVYRRRHDPRWTMDFISARCRDITGYDAHRFIGNASIAFAELIARADWSRVNEQVHHAVLRRQRVTVEYAIRTAHGASVLVEDRLTPIVDAAGRVLAIEGVVDHARSHQALVGFPVRTVRGNRRAPPYEDQPAADRDEPIKPLRHRFPGFRTLP